MNSVSFWTISPTCPLAPTSLYLPLSLCRSLSLYLSLSLSPSSSLSNRTSTLFSYYQGFLRVYFADESWSTLPVSEDTTSAQLCATIAKKRNLDASDIPFYNLYVSDESSECMCRVVFILWA